MRVELRVRRLLAIGGLLFAVVGCDEPRTAAPSSSRADVPRAGPPMEPLQPRPAEAKDRPEEAHSPMPTVHRSVIRSDMRLGWHHMGGVDVVEGAWTRPGAVQRPGDEQVQALGRHLQDCRTTELGAHERATWCPEVGLVERWGRERGMQIHETLIAIRRDGAPTWAESPCDAMHLLDDADRDALCARPMRTFGADPLPGRAPREASCRWRYSLDGPLPPGQRREPVVTVRLSADAAEIDAWAGATGGASFVESRNTRTWVARGPEWTAAVRVRVDRCGEDIDGRAFARQLVEIAPD